MSFITSHLYDGTTTYVHSTFDPVACKLTNGAMFTTDSGIYLEALSVLAYGSNNQTLKKQ